MLRCNCKIIPGAVSLREAETDRPNVLIRVPFPIHAGNDTLTLLP